MSDQGLHYLPLSTVWSRSCTTLSFSGTVWTGSTLSAILSSLISVYNICHYQQSAQGQGPLSFWVIVWSASILFAILSSLIRVYTVFHSQQSDQDLHHLLFSVWSGSTVFAVLSLIRVYTIRQTYTAVWSGSALFAILSSFINVKVNTVILRNSLIKVYTICHSKQSNQCLHCLSFSAV